MYAEPKKMSAHEKAAILFIALGSDCAAKVFPHMDEDEIETITLDIANNKQVSIDKKNQIIGEFYQLMMANDYISTGGIEFAQNTLEKALGADKAGEILKKLTTSLQVRPFEFLRKTDPSQLLNFLQNEHPQTIALVMAYLSPDQAGIVMSGLSIDMQADVAKRIALMDRTSPDVIREIEKVLEKKLSSLSTQDFTIAGGVPAVVEILNRVDRSTERAIIESLEAENPELAEEIKQLMFVFEDIILLDDRSVQLVVREVDTKELALAMKATNEDVTAKIYKNMSKRAADMLKEEISYMGPVKIRDVEEAQTKIVNVIRTLEDRGEIVIVRGQGEGMFV
ncbi:MAG: flagellar motor switch protein FliG [Selenomonadaceae bacterium]|nr:flagellar motor switch protein FliG [Selenomonadaceae bacterium]